MALVRYAINAVIPINGVEGVMETVARLAVSTGRRFRANHPAQGSIGTRRYFGGKYPGISSIRGPNGWVEMLRNDGYFQRGGLVRLRRFA